mgnify:CR=1 FL=1
MKSKFSVLLATLALALSANIQAAENTDAHHHHDHGSASPQQLQLNAGKKWATDAQLRQAMNDINQAMAKALPLIHKNQFGDQAYQALATTVSQKVAFAVEHCKLEPKADAMLHLVIADLMAGAETMEGKTANPRHDGAVRVLEALKAYGQYFQHSGWKAARG